MDDHHDIIFDWNLAGGPPAFAGRSVEVLDESLRDGLQSPSVVDPQLDDKLQLIRLLDDLGVSSVNIGFPGAGPRAAADALALARAIARECLRIRPACAARTLASDITPILSIAQESGLPIEVMAFIGSSPLRQYAEGWDLAEVARLSGAAIDLGVRHGLPVTYVNEDTVRSSPQALEVLFRAAIDHGAHRLCICDTVGHSTPAGVQSILGFTRQLIARSGAKVGIDWHGHNDRGLALSNALHAVEHGADRVHGTALGLGERVGNPPLELLLLNLQLSGATDRDLSKLMEYARLAARAFQVAVPFNYPLVGRDAFRTATGVHAAAILKAERKGQSWLADRIYSGVPAGLFGRTQEIQISHQSGEANVVYWLAQRGVREDPALISAILRMAKESRSTLADSEIEAVLRTYIEAAI